MQPDDTYLVDILHASKSALEFIKDVDEEQFYLSGLHQSAVIRQLEIIGEAAKKISSETKAAHPAIPWKKMAGLRDVLIHAYGTVNIKMVWRLVQEDIPALIEMLERLNKSSQ